MNINYTPEQGKACLEIENAELRKENQRLKDRIDFYEDIESDRLAYIDELDKENKQWKAMTKIAQTCAFCPYESYKKENKRLNNVLNELEKWLKEKQKFYGINQQGFSWGVAGDCLNKLNELKESDK